jgi:hypothetical protein
LREFGDKIRKALGAAICVALVDHQIAMLDISEIPQALSEYVKPVRKWLDRKPPKPYRPALLCLGEGHSSEPACENSDERPPVHH